jgi:hypothetical protein
MLEVRPCTVAEFFSAPTAEAREKVAALEQMALAMPQVAIKTEHLVHANVCARTIFIPAGTLLTGATMSVDNICVMFGDMTVTTDKGPVRFTGFHVLPANKGLKRAGLAHSDTWWTTIWKTELTEINDLEREMTSESDMLQTRRSGIEYAQPTHLEKEF